MAITSANFDQSKYGMSFTQLDLNKDNKIDNADLQLSTDLSVKTAITNVLADDTTSTKVNNTNSIFSSSSSQTASSLALTGAESYEAIVDRLKSTYSDKSLNGFSKALDEGILTTLSNQGFSRSEIIDIISEVFPNVGIKNNATGGFSCPNGHGAHAQSIYSKFMDQIQNIDTEEMQELRMKIDTLNTEIAENNLQLSSLHGVIQSLESEIESEINEAIDESKEIEEEQKEEAANIVSEELKIYSNSNGEVSYDEFQNNVSSKLNALSDDGESKIAKVVSKIVNAQSKMSTLKNYLDKFKSLNDANQKLNQELTTETRELEKCKCEDKKNNCCCKRTDPIGFSDGENRYDFFIDKDGNGDITNEKEFLGAENGWQEMTKLDADGNGKVSKDEMKDLKVVVTDKDGKQSVKNANEVFGDNDSINLKSYKALNTDMENGNTLLGTFGLTFNGQEIDDGYNTLDTINWLDENFDFTDEQEGINRFSYGNTSVTEKIQDFTSEYTDVSTKYTLLKEKLQEAIDNLGIAQDAMEALTDTNMANSKEDAEKINKLFNLKKAEV